MVGREAGALFFLSLASAAGIFEGGGDMAIITVSRGSYSLGARVAERVASRLGYSCLARDVLLEASQEFNVPELTLVKAIEDPPSVLDRITHGKARYVAYIRAALLKHFCEDNLVYHGLAGHFFLQGIRHAIKVRVLASLEDRVAIVMARDAVDEREARQVLARSDRARRQWGLHLYGIDTEDPALYDLVLHVDTMGIDGAAELVCTLAGQAVYRTTAESQAALEDLALGATVEAVLVDLEDHPSALVTAQGGEVLVQLKAAPRTLGGSFSDFSAHYVEDLRRRLLERVVGLHGLRGVQVELRED